MLHRSILKVILAGLLAITGLSITACATTDANEEALGGDMHQRHDTGIDSQVGDN